jgi:putative metallohydrolase (TIGR04338 family)
MERDGRRILFCVFLCTGFGLLAWLYLFMARLNGELPGLAARAERSSAAWRVVEANELTTSSARVHPVEDPRRAFPSRRAPRRRARLPGVLGEGAERRRVPPAPPEPSAVTGRVLREGRSAVAEATVSLWAHGPRSMADVLLGRVRTDWQGKYLFEEVRPSEEAWIEVEALYYLSYGGPLFSIPSGSALELVEIPLDFGGSIDGEVLDDAGTRVTGALVRFLPRSGKGGELPFSSTTDSYGTVLAAGLEPGFYTVEVLRDGVLAAVFEGLPVGTNGPTQKIEFHLEGGVVYPESQDPQQFHLYRSEFILSVPSKRFGSLEAIQGYVDGMLATEWFGRDFFPVPTVEVREAGAHDFPRGGPDLPRNAEEFLQGVARGHIELSSSCWDELTVLHEVAHVLSPGDSHGPLFARNFRQLVLRMLGEEAGTQLSLAYAAEGVRW